MRASPTVDAGSRWTRPGVTVTMEAVTPDRLDALAVRFSFDVPLETKQVLLLEWTGDHFA